MGDEPVGRPGCLQVNHRISMPAYEVHDGKHLEWIRE
jgi:hypothetical protein